MLIVALILLIVNAVWSLAIWPRFAVQIRKDPRSWEKQEEGKRRGTKFLRVHMVLVTVSLSLALVSLIIGIVGFF